MIYFNLFANCIPVRGFNRSVIYDLQKEQYLFIPNLLFEILELTKNNSVEEIKHKFNNDLDNGIENYFKSFTSKNLGFFTDSPNSFPSLDLTYSHPSHINTLIVDYEGDFKKLKSSIQLVESLGCRALEIICKNETNLTELGEIFNVTNNSSFDTVNIAIKASKVVTLENIKTFHYRNQRVKNVLVFLSEEDFKPIEMDTLNIEFSINSIEKIRKESKLEKQFLINNLFFYESQNSNPYFNRKIYLESNGNIKNAPECETTIENIQNVHKKDKLVNLVQSEKFTEYFHINKDKCDICKDCELRYMCFDSRLPIKRNENEWFYNSECSYNPYISKWDSEKNFKSLEKCGVQSNKKQFSIDLSRINDLNTELWHSPLEKRND